MQPSQKPPANVVLLAEARSRKDSEAKLRTLYKESGLSASEFFESAGRVAKLDSSAQVAAIYKASGLALGDFIRCFLEALADHLEALGIEHGKPVQSRNSWYLTRRKAKSKKLLRTSIDKNTVAHYEARHARYRLHSKIRTLLKRVDTIFKA